MLFLKSGEWDSKLKKNGENLNVWRNNNKLSTRAGAKRRERRKKTLKTSIEEIKGIGQVPAAPGAVSGFTTRFWRRKIKGSPFSPFDSPSSHSLLFFLSRYDFSREHLWWYEPNGGDESEVGVLRSGLAWAARPRSSRPRTLDWPCHLSGDYDWIRWKKEEEEEEDEGEEMSHPHGWTESGVSKIQNLPHSCFQWFTRFFGLRITIGL